jgi:hypothetical protein
MSMQRTCAISDDGKNEVRGRSSVDRGDPNLLAAW